MVSRVILDDEFSGFGRRTNGSCAIEESDCGGTRRGQYACCPEGMFCSGDTNTVCCPTDDDCTNILLQTPRCADQNWNMYNNTVPFCCSDDAAAAFKTGQDSNICADAGFQPWEGDNPLNTIPQDDDRDSDELSTTTSTIAPMTSLSIITSAGSSTTGNAAGDVEAPSSGESTNVGAIAGGVVGGVLGFALIFFLFWFLQRKQIKKKKDQQKLKDQQDWPPEFSQFEKHSAPNPVITMAEKDGSTRGPERTELETPERAELGAYYKSPHQQPGELVELT